MTAIGNGGIAPVGADRAGTRPRSWKTITIGNYRTSVALRDALVARNVWIGDLAAEMLRLPPFALAPAATAIELVDATVAQLGIRSDRASFAAIHAHAIEAGLDLCPAEAGPQLRLQYPEQRIGEYLVIGMKPLPTANGSDACFVIGNGGAGLVIIGRSAGPDAMVASRSRFVFALHR